MSNQNFKVRTKILRIDEFHHDNATNGILFYFN